MRGPDVSLQWSERHIWDLRDSNGDVLGHVWDCGTGRFGWVPDDDRIGSAGDREDSLAEAQAQLVAAVEEWQRTEWQRTRPPSKEKP